MIIKNLNKIIVIINNTWHLLIIYYVPGAVLSTLHVLFHSSLTATYKACSITIPTLKIRKLNYWREIQ